MNFKRFYAVLVARNLEFLRDRGALGWSLIFPVFMVIGLAFAFSGRPALYDVGLVGVESADAQTLFGLEARLVDWVPIESVAEGEARVGRHALDLLLEPDSGRYWRNPDSGDGQVLSLLLERDGTGAWQSTAIAGEALRYIDWAAPGVIAMNIMFAALYGIGFVIVRYRKTGMLKRVMATPVTPVEFLGAQLASRLMVIALIHCTLFLTLIWLVDLRMLGSYALLLLVMLTGTVALIAIGGLVAARVSNEELANGILNLATWPMMLLSEVWFSMDNAAPWLQKISQTLPLTHMTQAARAIMLDGAGFVDVAHHLAYLGVLAALFLGLGAWLFRWE